MDHSSSAKHTVLLRQAVDGGGQHGELPQGIGLGAATARCVTVASSTATWAGIGSSAPARAMLALSA